MAMKIMSPKQHSGFTLIELVMVVVLIGVLSFGGISLFASRSGYSTFVAKDLLISQALLAQQVALGNSGSANPVSLTISVTANDWNFTLQKAGFASNETASVDSSGNTLQVDGAAVGAGASRTFTWTNAAALSDNANHEIRFVGDNSFRVCLSSQGFAYESAVACP